MSTFPGKKLAAGAVTAAFGMAVCVSASAQTTQYQNAPAQGQVTTNQAAVYPQDTARSATWHVRASELLDEDVENARGETLGEVRDVIFNIADQNVRYVVLESGGFAGIGEELRALPVQAFARRGGELVLNVSQEQLENLPRFTRDNWPDWNNARYRQQLDAYFGLAAQDRPADGQEAAHMRRVSTLLDRDVSDRTGREVGEIEDLVIDLDQGSVAYAVLEFDTDWNVDDRLLPLPLTAIAFPADQGQDLVVDTEFAQTGIARGFDEDRWPDLNEQSFRESMNAWFQEPEWPPVPGQAGVVTPSVEVFEGN